MPVMRAPSLFAFVAMALMLSGCLARAAADIVTAPVRVAARGVDLATTSQSEADEARGREIRRREERLGALERDYAKQREKSQDGSRRACEEANAIRDEIEELLPTLPLEPEER